MAEAIYSITYWPEVSVIEPGSGQEFFKVKSILEGVSGVGISLTKKEYNDWKKEISPYHYINEENFTIRNAFINNEKKIEDEEKAFESAKEFNVYSLWNLYKSYDSIGNSIKSAELKSTSRANALLLSVEGKKAFIITQMIFIKEKISVLTDLEIDFTELQQEYDDLILEYNSLIIS